MTPTPTDTPCHLCQHEQLLEFTAFRELPRVTSDCQPWPAGGRMAICPHCGTVQTPATAEWNEEIEEIYRRYSIYAQGDGAEQCVFDAATGESLPRSTRLCRLLKDTGHFGESGRHIDIGCGNGGFLKRFHESFPQWSLVGTEYNEKYVELVEALPSVEKMVTGPLSDVDGTFDSASLIHVLEHIENPIAFLTEIRKLLPDGGKLFIEVPFYQDNAYELAIADHATHYSPESLSRIVKAAGYKVARVTTEWVSKELSLLAIKTDLPESVDVSAENSHEQQALSDRIDGMSKSFAQAKALAASTDNFGLFGTSIAATWLWSGLKDQIKFFVDEDPNRIGNTHLGVPILSPVQVPADATVFVGLPPALATRIVARLNLPHFKAAIS